MNVSITVPSKVSTRSHYRWKKSSYCPSSASSLRAPLQCCRMQSPVVAASVAGNQHIPTDILAILLPLIDQCDKKRGGLACAPVTLAYQHSWSMKVKQDLGQDYGNSRVQSGHNSQGNWLTVLITGGGAGGHDSEWIQQEAMFQIPIKYKWESISVFQ